MSGDSRVIDSPAAMQALAHELAGKVTGGSLLLLVGELGAGKTTFVQGLAAALGITAAITSPTFTIASEYPVITHPTITQLLHIDLYRLEPAQAQRDVIVAELLDRVSDPGRLTIIEWADRLGEQAASLAAIRLSLHHGQTPHQRLVTIT